MHKGLENVNKNQIGNKFSWISFINEKNVDIIKLIINIIKSRKFKSFRNRTLKYISVLSFNNDCLVSFSTKSQLLEALLALLYLFQ